MGAADSVEGYTRWYGRLLRAVVHIDVKVGQFILFHRATQTIYRSAKAHDAGAVRGDSDCVSRPTRPAPSVYRDRLKRTISISQSYTTKHAQASSRSSASSPKVQLSPSQSSTPSSRASPQASSFTPSYQGVHLDPFPSIAARNDHDHSAYVPPPPDDGSESPLSNAQLSTLDSRKQAFDPKIRQALWLLAEEFSGSSTLLRGFRDAKLNKERIASLTLEALAHRRKSPAAARGVIKNASGLIQFPIDSRGESHPEGVALTGDASVVLLRDYLESVADRCRTVPGAVKTSLSTWPDALGAPWPLGNPLVFSAAHVGSSEIHKHDPPTKLDTFKKLESMALNVEIAPFKRAFPLGSF